MGTPKQKGSKLRRGLDWGKRGLSPNSFARPHSTFKSGLLWIRRNAASKDFERETL